MTHGSIDRHQGLGAFVLTETSHAPNGRLPRHAHRHPAITFVLSGSFVEDFGGRYCHSCHPQSIILKPAGAQHTNRYAESGARSFILECIGADPLFEGFERCAPQVGFEVLAPLLLELYFAFRDETPQQHLAAEEAAVEVLARADRVPAPNLSKAPSWLPLIIEAVRAPGPTPRLGTLAGIVDLHPVYLARVFRRHMRRSIGSYVLHVRLERALQRLAATDKSIARIAFECGFSDQPHLTRLCQREVGMAPGQYRRLARSVSRLDHAKRT